MTWRRAGYRTTEIGELIDAPDKTYTMEESVPQRRMAGNIRWAKITVSLPRMYWEDPVETVDYVTISGTAYATMSKFAATDVGNVRVDRLIAQMKHANLTLTSEPVVTAEGILKLQDVVRDSARAVVDAQDECIAKAAQNFQLAPPPQAPSSSMATATTSSGWSHSLWNSLTNFVSTVPLVRIVGQCIVTLAVMWILQHFLPQILEMGPVREMVSGIESAVHHQH